MIETWKDIPGYEGIYQADKEGHIRRLYVSGNTRLLRPYRKKMRGSQRLVVRLSVHGKCKEEKVLRLVAITFLGPPPAGCVPYHKNGCQTENHINNIAYISRKELGKLTGGKAGRKPVAKIDRNGQIVEVYSSATEAARKNYLSRNAMIDRCNGIRRSAFSTDGYAYAWEDTGIEKAIEKIKAELALNPKLSFPSWQQS